MDISQFLQQLDFGTVTLVCGGLCVLGVILFVVLPVVGGVFDIVLGVADLLSGIVAGGPASGCGCFILLGLCALAACVAVFTASVLSTCGTPEAVNFCALFGR